MPLTISTTLTTYAQGAAQDAIQPVEEAYDRWGDRIAMLGGMDLDFICRSPAEAVHQRSLAMVERSAERGSYALGTGNSVPEYIPQDKYFAMISAATKMTYV